MTRRPANQDKEKPNGKVPWTDRRLRAAWTAVAALLGDVPVLDGDITTKDLRGALARLTQEREARSRMKR